jgi:hypothetical protein
MPVDEPLGVLGKIVIGVECPIDHLTGYGEVACGAHA